MSASATALVVRGSHAAATSGIRHVGSVSYLATPKIRQRGGGTGIWARANAAVLLDLAATILSASAGRRGAGHADANIAAATGGLAFNQGRMMMSNTKAEPGAFDVLAEQKAAPDEPKFTLWGRDPLAPLLVREWARRNRERVFAATDMGPEKRKLELIQSTDADEISFDMEEFRRGQVKEASEAREAEQRPGYAGNAMGADELAAKERHDTLLNGSRKLDNALSESLDIAIAIHGYGDYSAAEMLIHEAVEKLREASATIRPARPSYAHKA